MKTSIHDSFDTKGNSLTLYRPRLNLNFVNNKCSILRLNEKHRQGDENIGFCLVILGGFNVDSEKSKFGAQSIRSPLSYRLLPIEGDFIAVSNLKKAALKKRNTRDFHQGQWGISR